MAPTKTAHKWTRHNLSVIVAHILCVLLLSSTWSSSFIITPKQHNIKHKIQVSSGSCDAGWCWQSSASLPASPYALYRSSSQFTWRLQPLTPQSTAGAGTAGSRRPLVLPCLENLDLPYADDSAATTPTSDDLCSFQNAQNTRTYQRQQRLSTASAGIRLSQLEMRLTGGAGSGVSRTGSRASRQSRHSVVASNAATLSGGTTTTQLEIHAPRLKVKYFFLFIIINIIF